MNTYEDSMRDVKARALCDAVVDEYRAMMGTDIKGNSISDADLLEMIEANQDTEDWSFFAELAEVNPPSDTTIDMVYRLIRHKLTRVIPIPDDPFEGLLGY